MNEAWQEYLEQRAAAHDRVCAVVLEILRSDRTPDQLDPDVPLFGSGFGLDSIDAVDLIVALDTTFGIRLGDDVFGRTEMRTINGLVDLVMRQALVEAAQHANSGALEAAQHANSASLEPATLHAEEQLDAIR